jgi:hypothetical protein
MIVVLVLKLQTQYCKRRHRCLPRLAGPAGRPAGLPGNVSNSDHVCNSHDVELIY